MGPAEITWQGDEGGIPVPATKSGFRDALWAGLAPAPDTASGRIDGKQRPQGLDPGGRTGTPGMVIQFQDGAFNTRIQESILGIGTTACLGNSFWRSGKGEFFSLWSLQVLLIFSVLGPERLKNWLDSQKIDDVQVVEELLSDHHLSINASRAWGFHALYSATGDEKWQSAYVEHVRAAIGLHSEWKDNRSAYSHWVPQFTLYAILIAY